jgi:DNA-binding CsgD family transcriptional regulator
MIRILSSHSSQATSMNFRKSSSTNQTPAYHLGVVESATTEIATLMASDVLSLLCPEWEGPRIVVDDGDLAVLHANQAAVDILKDHADCLIENSMFRFRGDARMAAFQSALQNSVPTSNSTRAFVYRSISGKLESILAYRLRLPATLLESFGASRVAVLEFRTVGAKVDPTAFTALAAALNLSPAEAKDLKLLAAGHPLERIAELRSVELSTVRQNVKSILAKVHCSRQVELVQIVQALCPSRSV